MNDSNAVRREHNLSQFAQIVRVGKKYTMAQLMTTILRNKNFNGNPYDATEAEMANVLEDTLEELKSDSQADFHEKNSANGQA